MGVVCGGVLGGVGVWGCGRGRKLKAAIWHTATSDPWRSALCYSRALACHTPLAAGPCAASHPKARYHPLPAAPVRLLKALGTCMSRLLKRLMCRRLLRPCTLRQQAQHEGDRVKLPLQMRCATTHPSAASQPLPCR